VVALRQRQSQAWFADQVHDPAAGGWTALPRDPLVPAFARQITSTPHGLVLTGKAEVAQPNSDGPSVVRAAVLDPATEQWRQLPDSDQLGGPAWTWTGRRMVDPALGGADGGEVNGFGRTIPHGGTLDPAAGTWGPLPNAPEELTGGWQAYAVSGPHTASGGYFYDDASETWTSITRPEGAPEAPGAAVWAGDSLIVFGGFTDDEGYVSEGLSHRAFLYGPAAAPTPAGCPPGARCPAPPAPDVRFDLTVDGRLVTSPTEPLPLRAGQEVQVSLKATAPDRLQLRTLIVGDADGSWGVGPEGPTGFDQTLVDEQRIDAASTSHDFAWTPAGATGLRFLVAIFSVTGGERPGASIGVVLATAELE
jgi:hypothetical protein